MDTIINKNYNFLNFYSFVRIESDKNDPSYIEARQKEHSIMTNQRNAVTFCKNVLAINTYDLSKIGNEEKEAIENCLRENFLYKNPNYFGKRDTIYLDLHNY
jgi:hypothetical protein